MDIQITNEYAISLSTQFYKDRFMQFLIIRKDNIVDFTWSVVSVLVGISRHVIWLPYLLGFIDIHLRSGFCAKYRPIFFILVPQKVPL